MIDVQPAMLWEAMDALTALQRRFGFASVEEAGAWLRDAVADQYGIDVEGVERLVINSYNFLAWLRTAEGPLIAKCCGWGMLHARLVKIADLLASLQEEGLPVSVPLPARTGLRQVLVDGRSIGLQRVVAGELLDALQPQQAQAAGVTLARLHRALAAYPQAATLDEPAAGFAEAAAAPSLEESTRVWVAQKGMTSGQEQIVAGSRELREMLEGEPLSPPARQLVHHDFRAANLIWDGERIAAVLDFEELRWGHRVEDLAWAAVHLGTLFHDWGPAPHEVHEVFLAAYRAELPLTKDEEAWLPTLLRWHGLELPRK